MLGGATGAMRPLGRGKTGPSSLASSGQTLTGVEAPVWGSVQASVPPSSVSKQRCDDCPRGCSVSPFLLGHGLAWARVTGIAATVFVASMTGGTWVPFVGGVGSGTTGPPFLHLRPELQHAALGPSLSRPMASWPSPEPVGQGVSLGWCP